MLCFQTHRLDAMFKRVLILFSIVWARGRRCCLVSRTQTPTTEGIIPTTIMWVSRRRTFMCARFGVTQALLVNVNTISDCLHRSRKRLTVVVRYGMVKNLKKGSFLPRIRPDRNSQRTRSRAQLCYWPSKHEKKLRGMRDSLTGWTSLYFDIE